MANGFSALGFRSSLNERWHSPIWVLVDDARQVGRRVDAAFIMVMNEDQRNQ